MRSRVDVVRHGAELVLRAVALGALAALLWRAIRPPVAGADDVARGDLGPALARWTFAPPGNMHVVLDAAPPLAIRDWARALGHAGAGTLRWSASRPIGAGAIVAEPVAEPNGATRVRVASAGREPVTVGDEAGLIDTMPAGGTAELELATVAGDARLTSATFTATTRSRDSVLLRPVLVLGSAGWESKFTIAALEERGWHVASRVRVAPNIQVRQGPLTAIDTGRYAAVILLDSSAAASAGDVARYARSGGGVILAGSAARLGAVGVIAPGSVGRRVGGVAGAIGGAAPRTGLAAFAVVSPKSDAVRLESRDGTTLVAARRVDAGRVLQVGYDETWRWRMAGGDGAVAAHREWWSRLVAAVAYAPLVPRTAGPSALNETPLASLVDALGSPELRGARSAPRGDPARLTKILFALVVASLLLEWTSRRLRGAR